MAEFEKLEPGDVVVGRGRAAKAARAPYIEAVRVSDAGRIKLEEGENVSTVRRLLFAGAKAAGKRVRAAYETDENALYWKVVGAK